MKTTLAAILAMVGMIGCSSKEWDEQAMQGDETQMSRGGPRDDSTRLQEDPVCGRTVNPKTSAHEEYDDQTFYFHDEECAQKFRDNPHAYLPGGDDRDVAARMEADPVCGTMVDSKLAIRETYENRPYFFHSERCAEKFKADPQAYINKAKSEDRVREVR